MITALQKRLSSEVADIRSQIVTSARIRALLAGPKRGDPEIEHIATTAPGPAAWAAYDHSAAITRLYAAYERFVEDLAAEWLSYQPRICPNYSDLSERIKRSHREGVGRILSTLHYRRHRHIDPISIIDSLRQGLTASPYTLDPAAFVQSDRNLQPDVLREFFNSIGIDEMWDWLDQHNYVTNFFSNSTRTDFTLENAVKDFVNYRNEAAHGLADNILGLESLVEQGLLIEALGNALAELVLDRILEGYLSTGIATRIGVITEIFEKAGAVVAACDNGTLFVGDSLFVRGPRSCRKVFIESIKFNNHSCNWISIKKESEIGLVIGKDIKQNWELIKM